MNHLMSAVTKGVAVGAVVGTAAYMMKAKKSRTRIMKKNASKVMKTVGGVIENVGHMMK